MKQIEALSQPLNRGLITETRERNRQLAAPGKKQSVAFEYLPIMAQAGAPKPPRVLVAPSNPAWCPIKKPLSRSRVALLSSVALLVPY